LNTEFGGPSVIVQSFRDAHGLRAGADFQWSRSTALRGGLVVNAAAAPDQTVTPQLPEAARVQLTGGLGQRLSERLSIDLYYLRLFQDDRRGRTTDGGLEIPTAALNNGVYSFHANLFGASIVVRF
jgi:long-chain fatty acid transport protein